MIFGHGVEELELIAPSDVLRRAGAEVWWLSWESTGELLTRGGFRIRATHLLECLTTASLDMLVLPGGPGVMAVRSRPDLMKILRDYAQTNKPLAAICAAPLLLHDAGLLNGRRFTCHQSCMSELSCSERDDEVVIDQQLITSRGAGTALSFGLALVECLYGADVKKEVARSIELTTEEFD